MIIGGNPRPDRIFTDETWMQDGLCGEFESEMWFPDPEKGEQGAEAKAICRQCPVKIECLEYGTKHDEHGIWGGLTQKARRQRKWRLQREGKSRTSMKSGEVSA